MPSVPECTCIGDTRLLGLKVVLKDGDHYGDLVWFAILRIIDTLLELTDLDDLVGLDSAGIGDDMADG